MNSRLPAIAAAVAFCAFSAAIFWAVSNVPSSDDFDMLLAPVLDLKDGSRTLLQILFSRHGEHLVVLPRFLAIASTQILGSINFSLLTLIGNFALAAVLLLKGKNFGKLEKTVLALLLFQPSFIESSLWASGSLQHLLGAALPIAAFLLAANGRLWIAALATLLACLTQGNGAFCPLIIGLLLFRDGKRRAALIWTLSSLAMIALHLKGSSSTSSHLSANFSALPDLAIYVVGFLGGGLGFGRASLALGAGIILVLAFVVFLVRNYRTADFTWLGLAGFCFITACANAWARAGFGTDYAYSQSRYTLISLLFFASTAFLYAGQNQKVRAVLPWLALLVSSCWWAARWSEIPYRHELSQDSAMLWQASGTGVRHTDKAHAKSLLDRAGKSGIYRFPEVALTVAEEASSTVEVSARPIIGRLGPIRTTRDGKYIFLGHAFPKESPVNKNYEVLLEFVGPTGDLQLFKPERRYRPDLARTYGRSWARRAGFIGAIDRSKLPRPGSSINLLLCWDGVSSRLGTTKSIPPSND